MKMKQATTYEEAVRIWEIGDSIAHIIRDKFNVEILYECNECTYVRGVNWPYTSFEELFINQNEEQPSDIPAVLWQLIQTHNQFYKEFYDHANTNF